jgi:hypothetical protein
MRTESTFSFGAFIELEAVPAGVDALALGALVRSSVPVISTLWPTCALSFESSASSLYVLPVAEVAEDGLLADVPVGLVALVPAVALEGELELDELAFVRMKADSLELALDVPLVPVAPAVAVAEPFCTHPVTVI